MMTRKPEKHVGEKNQTRKADKPGTCEESQDLNSGKSNQQDGNQVDLGGAGIGEGKQNCGGYRIQSQFH